MYEINETDFAEYIEMLWESRGWGEMFVLFGESFGVVFEF